MTVTEHSPVVAPVGTKWTRLGDVADINPKWNPLAAKEDPVSFVGMAQMSDVLGCVTDEEQRRVQEVRTGYTAFEQGDLLVAKITPCFENGKIGQANIANKWGAGSTEFHVVRPGDRLDAGYALHFLRRQQFRTSGKLRMTGSGGQQRVPASYVADTKIPLPPLPEQRRIAAILDKADQLRTQRREALAQLDALARSMFDALFGGMTDNPMTLKQAGVGFVSGKSLVASGTDGVPNNFVLKVNAVSSGQFDASQIKGLPPKYLPPDTHRVAVGDLIVTRASGSKDLIGVATVVDQVGKNVYLPDKLWKATFSGGRTLPEYFRWLTLSPQYRAHVVNVSSGAAGVSNISQANLLSLEISLPPLDLQQTFARQVAGVERLKEQHRAQVAELDTLFASMQHRAFRGDL